MRPDAVHVCYINTVSRFVFDAARYVGGFGLGRAGAAAGARLAAWDVRAAQRPTRFVANSRNVAARVRRWYGRDADVLPCPVDVDRFTVGAGSGDYYVGRVAAAAVQAHRPRDRGVRARRRPAARRRHRARTSGGSRRSRSARARPFTARSTTPRATRCSATRAPRSCRAKKTSAWSRSRPRRRAARRSPTRAGGALETIVDGRDRRVLPRARARSALADAIRAFDPTRYDPAALRAHAEEFRPERFIARLRALVDETVAARASARPRDAMNACAARDGASIRPTRGVVIAALVFALVYVALDLNKLYALRYGADTGTFVQLLAGEAHGRGSWNGAEYRPHLQVHDSWVLLALVPLMAAFPYAQTLLVRAGARDRRRRARAVRVRARLRREPRAARARSGSRTCSRRRRRASRTATFWRTCSCRCSPRSARSRCAARALVAALIVAQLLLGLKEDQALFLAWFGVACALWWDRRIGLARRRARARQRRRVRRRGAADAARSPSLPGYALHVDDPLRKLAFFAALLAPFAFAPLLLRWRLLLGAPLVAELVFNRPVGVSDRADRHALDRAVRRRRRRSPRRTPSRSSRALAAPMLVCAALCALALNDTVLKLGRWPFVVDRAAYARAAALRATRARPSSCAVRDEGAYVVAAANPHVAAGALRSARDAATAPPTTRTRARSSPRWASARGRAGTALCGGVPVPATSGGRTRCSATCDRVERAVREHRRDQRAAAAVDPGQHDPAARERRERAACRQCARPKSRAAEQRGAARTARSAASALKTKPRKTNSSKNGASDARQQREAGDQQRVVRAGQDWTGSCSVLRCSTTFCSAAATA